MEKRGEDEGDDETSPRQRQSAGNTRHIHNPARFLLLLRVLAEKGEKTPRDTSNPFRETRGERQRDGVCFVRDFCVVIVKRE